MRQKTPFIAFKPKDVKEAAWRAVIDAWSNGLSDREAAFLASRDSSSVIKESTLKEWLKDKDIADLKDHLQTELLMKAKLTIAKRIDEEDIRTAKWYLERKAADEFSTKAAVAFEGAVVDITLEEKEKKMRDFMKQFEGKDGE